MVSRRSILFLLLLVLVTTDCFAQVLDSHSELNALAGCYVKSLDEFMHRFNAEEIPSFVKKDSTEDIRYRCIVALFDFEQVGSNDLDRANRILEFAADVCESNTFLHITSPGLYAEAHCAFKYKKRDVNLNLVLSYESRHEDFYNWVIVGVNGMEEAELIDTVFRGRINPVNNELHFSELSSAFPHMGGFMSKSHEFDLLSYLAGLSESGNLQYKSCQSVTYYVTHVPGYVFTITQHPRRSMNSGWLIHDLIEIDDIEKDSFVKKLIGGEL